MWGFTVAVGVVSFGTDVSNHNAGVSLADAAQQGYSFVMAKCTEGTGYVDPFYSGFRRDAQAAGLLFAGYHALHAGQIRAQAELLAAHIGDTEIPVMLDAEPFGTSHPKLGDVAAFILAADSLGLSVPLLYLPRWYWEQLGSPDLTGLPGRPSVVASDYPDQRHVHGSKSYPGNSSQAWAAYGGDVPIVLQFTDNGLIDGYSGGLDLDGFRGTRADLAKLGLFKDYAVNTAPHPRRNHPHPHPVREVRSWWRHLLPGRRWHIISAAHEAAHPRKGSTK